MQDTNWFIPCAFLANVAGLTANGLVIWNWEAETHATGLLWASGGFAVVNLAFATLFGAALCCNLRNKA